MIEIDGVIKDSLLKKVPNIFTLRFKYQLPFEFTSSGKTVSLLDKIEVE